MRSRLYLRIAGIALATLTLTLLTAAILTAQLIRVEQRQVLDQVLRREHSALQLGLSEQLTAATGGLGTADANQLDRAVERYLALHPGSEQHVTVIRLGTRILSTRDGPTELQEMQQNGTLPTGAVGRIQTVDSPAGPLRVLTADVSSRGQVIAQVSVLGPLSPGRDQAQSAFLRIAAAGAVGLVLGGMVLLIALRRALRPVEDLATAARSVDLNDLSSRVPEPTSKDEVAAMAHEFNRMLDRIRDDQRHRRQLLSAISHELRTPLAVARGHLELLETLGPAEGYSAAETAAVVRRELDRLGRIVDDLTAINQGESGARVDPEPVFAPDVTDALSARLAGLGFDDVHVTAPPPVVLLGNEDRLTQALLNLVVNARTHTPPGTPVSVNAEISNNTHRREITFAVRDSGPGIDPAVRDHVFDPFVTTKSDGSGRTSGLGLSVVKAVIEALGGRVAMETGSAGTVISLTLPLDAEGHDHADAAIGKTDDETAGSRRRDA